MSSQEFLDFLSIPFLVSHPAVPRLFHHPPDESENSGGGSYSNPSDGSFDYRELSNASDDTPYLPQRVYESLGQPSRLVGLGFLADPRSSISSFQSSELFQQNFPVAQNSRINSTRSDAQQWDAILDPVPAQPYTDSSFYSHASSLLPPRNVDPYASLPPIPRLDYSGFFSEQDLSGFDLTSNSPSPSSEYGSSLGGNSPGSFPHGVNYGLLQSEVTPSDPQIDQWLRSEINIPRDLPVALSSLDDHPSNQRPPLALKWIMALAIYGSPKRTLTLNGIYEAVEERFPFYRNTRDKKWQRSMRHSLSLYSMFRHGARPISESGKGGYWEVVYTPPGANPYKRQRKRRTGSATEDEVDVSDEGDRTQEEQPLGGSRTRSRLSPYPIHSSPQLPSPVRLPSSRPSTPSGYGIYNRQQPRFGETSFLPPQDVGNFSPQQQRPGPVSPLWSPIHDAYGAMIPPRSSTAHGGMPSFESFLMHHGGVQREPEMTLTPGGPYTPTPGGSQSHCGADHQASGE